MLADLPPRGRHVYYNGLPYVRIPHSVALGLGYEGVRARAGGTANLSAVARSQISAAAKSGSCFISERSIKTFPE